MSMPGPTRALFVEPLLVAPEVEREQPTCHYDEARGLTLLLDGRPVVETGLDGWGGTRIQTRRFPADVEDD